MNSHFVYFFLLYLILHSQSLLKVSGQVATNMKTDPRFNSMMNEDIAVRLINTSARDYAVTLL